MISYKKIITSRNLRLAILDLLRFIPDELMIRIQYFIKTGRKLHLFTPKRYTEKLQWYKLRYRNPVMKQCVDKYEVREYVRKKGLQRILTKIYGVYDDFSDIDWKKLPNKFVVKKTTGGGGNEVLIVEDKSNFDIEKNRSLLVSWLKPKKKHSGGREWFYEETPSKILFEEYIESDKKSGGLVDYKFFCFGGRVEFVYGITDRKIGEKASLGIFTRDFVQLPIYREDELPLTRTLIKPKNYEEMITIAELLSKDFPHARIDLYNQEGKILFGEITFCDGSGYMTYNPDEFDFIMGSKFNIENIDEVVSY